ncbi:AHH domain-containing protein [Planctopirus ephydatiae]|uniref:AHH domain-containing protein n=1 Tax=Planctopirus ephydatiae TaxID=2528019 RepID=UPI001C96180B|nr:AHH domain-containing protein [Planctopirus ephydatiae]
MGSGTSQADDLQTDMTFDLASTGFGLHYEITQDQGQSRTKAGSLTEEVVIGGRSRSQESTTDLWVNLAGYGNWTNTSSSGWSESVSNYEFSRRIDKSYWYGRQSYQVSPVSYGRTSTWTSSGDSSQYGPYAGTSGQNALFNPETGLVDYTYSQSEGSGSGSYESSFAGSFESGTAHDLAEWNVTFSNPMSLINQALAPYNYYNLPFIPQAFTNAMGGYELSYLGDWHLSSEGWASDTQYYKYYENDRTGDWRIDYWDHKPAENETPKRSEYGGPSYDSIQQEAYAAQQQAQSQANQPHPDEAPAAKSADQNRLEEEQSASGSEGGSYTPSNPVAPGNEVGQASRNAMDRAYERLGEQQSNPHIRDLLNRNEHDLGTLIDRAPYRPTVNPPRLQFLGNHTTSLPLPPPKEGETQNALTVEMASELEAAFLVLYGTKGQNLLQAYKKAGGVIEFGDYWYSSKLGYQPGNVYQVIWIDTDLNPVEQAEQLMLRLIDASAYHLVRRELVNLLNNDVMNDELYEQLAESYRAAVREAAASAAALSELYVQGITVFNTPLGITIGIAQFADNPNGINGVIVMADMVPILNQLPLDQAVRIVGPNGVEIFNAVTIKIFRNGQKAFRDGTIEAMRKLGVVYPEGVPTQAHHLIPLQLMKDSKIVAQLNRLGFNIHDPSVNGLLLPTVDYLGRTARIHSGSHPEYTKMVENLLSRVTTKQELDELLEYLRGALLSSPELGRLN